MTGRRFNELGDLWRAYIDTLEPEARHKFSTFPFDFKFYCLDRVLDEVSQRQEDLKGKSFATDGTGEMVRSMVWMQFLAETFAYHAFRVAKELRARKLPGFSKFKPPEGILSARQLMEHFGEGNCKVTTTGFAVFDVGWPHVRPQRHRGEPAQPIDKGLQFNADQFIDEIEMKLKNAIQQRTSMKRDQA
jgi:hypothetical protein